MRPKQLASVCLCLVAIASSGCAAWYPTPPTSQFEKPLNHFGLSRFDEVAHDIYRGSQPRDAAQFRDLVQQYQIQTVIKLNGGSDPDLPNIIPVSHPLGLWRVPSSAEIQKILEDIDRAPKPVFIHCTHGEDRTGLIVALYKIRHGMSSEDAYADMLVHGFHPYQGLWKTWLREAKWRRSSPTQGAARSAGT